MYLASVFTTGDNLAIGTWIACITPSVFEPAQVIPVTATGKTVLPGFRVIVRIFHACTKLNKQNRTSNGNNGNSIFIPVFHGDFYIIRAVINCPLKFCCSNLRPFVCQGFQKFLSAIL